MMNKLTSEQIQQIKDLLKTGEYYHHKTQEINIKKEVLYEAFCLYAHYRGIKNKCFKTRHFRPIERPNRNDRGAFYHDIPMTPFQVLRAIRYGIDQGEITVVRGPSDPIKVSHIVRVYRFNNNHISNEGMHNEKQLRDEQLRDLR